MISAASAQSQPLLANIALHLFSQILERNCVTIGSSLAITYSPLVGWPFFHSLALKALLPARQRVRTLAALLPHIAE
jgi:hypothetical protein